MNLKTTIVLIVLAVGCVALFWKGPALAPMLGLAPKPITTRDDGTAKSLAELPVKELTRLEIDVPGQPKLVLQAAGPGQPLNLPGHWPIRRTEVDDLAQMLRDLKSRYYPIGIDDKTDLTPYGLADDQKPITISIETPKGREVYKFGEAPLHAGENPFTRPAYVRMEGKHEVLRLGPQVIPMLQRNEDAYRRRQLFPDYVRVRVAEPKRVRIPGMDEPERTPPTTFLIHDTDKITVKAPGGSYVLQRVEPMPEPEPPADRPDDEPVVQPARLANAWNIVEPVRDRLDPDKARAILTAIPNLWVEKFVESAAGTEAFFGLGEHADVTPQLLTFLGGAVPGMADTPYRAALNYLAVRDAKSPTAALGVTLHDGSQRTLHIGRVSRTIGSDDLRFAKIEMNPLIFEMKVDKLGDLQINLGKPPSGSPSSPVDDLRDPSLVRFNDDQVTGVDIAYKSGKDERRIQLEKAGNDWKMVLPVADTADKTEVTELLNMLKGMEARKGSIIDGSLGLPSFLAGGLGALDTKQLLGLQPDHVKKLTLTFDAKSGLQPATFLIGMHDAAANKRVVMVQGWPRINVVDDRIEGGRLSRLDRQPSSYRTLKLFDRLGAKIGEIEVNRAAADGRPADKFTVQEHAGPPPKWSIIAPFKAEADGPAVSLLASELGNLAEQKYVFDAKTDVPYQGAPWPAFFTGLGLPAPTGDAIFGLDKPTATLTLKFSAPKGAPDVTVEIGGKRSDTEYFARVKGSTGVFAIPDRVVKALDHKPEELVDKTLIQFAVQPEVQSIQRSMGGQELEIAQDNSARWEIVKPTRARADENTVNELAQSLSLLRATRIEAVVPKSLKEYGLEPPVATVTVAALEKTKIVEKILLVGNPVDAAQPNGDRYVKAQGSTMVAVIGGTLAQKLVGAPQTFRDLSLGGFVNADKMEMEKGDRRVVFVKGAGGWKLKEPLEADAEDEELRELHDSLAKLRADEIVEDQPKDLAKYGLDKPTQWRIFNGAREVLHVRIGNREKIGTTKKIDGERVFAMVGKGDTVYLLGWRLSHALTTEYRKRSLWDKVEPMQITKVEFKAPSPKDSFTFEKGPGTIGWIDPANLADRLNSPLMNELVQTISTLRIDHYVVDKGADLAKFGLDKPRIMTVTADDGKKRVLLLGKLADGHLYAKLDDPANTGVFVLTESDSEFLNRPRATFSLNQGKAEPKKETPKDLFKKSDSLPDLFKKAAPKDKKP